LGALKKRERHSQQNLKQSWMKMGRVKISLATRKKRMKAMMMKELLARSFNLWMMTLLTFMKEMKLRSPTWRSISRMT